VSGYQGIQSREQYFAKYAKLLTEDPDQQKLVADGKAPISHRTTTGR
jgi:CHASE3 domain sensor protein